MRIRTAFLSTAAVALMLAAPAMAQSQSNPNAAMPRQSPPNTAMQPSMQNGGQQLGAQDRNFMKEAAIGGMAEVDLGNLAQQKGQSDQVKQFGARMVQDHTQANNELMSIAGQQGIQLPQQLDQKHQAMHDRLSRLQGSAFDRAYMSDMVKDHDEDVRAFRREAQEGRDPALKQFAAKTLNVIEQHDKLARDVDRSLTATGSSRAPR